MAEPEEETVASVWNMRCPKCGSDEAIRVEGRVWMNLYADGTDADGDHEWDADDRAYCDQCDFQGTVGDFDIKTEGEKRDEETK